MATQLIYYITHPQTFMHCFQFGFKDFKSSFVVKNERLFKFRI